MLAGSFFAEVLSTIRSKQVSTILTASLVAAMCITALVTVGRTAAAEAQVASSLDAAGSRVLEISDARDLGIIGQSQVDAAARLSSVEAAIGRSTAFDIRNAVVGSGGTPVAAWVVIGQLDAALRLDEGRWPKPGEAVLSQEAAHLLGIAGPTGEIRSVDGVTYPVVGTFFADAGFSDFNEGVLIAGGNDVTAVTLRIFSDSAATAAGTEKAVLANLDRSDPADLVIESPTSIADLQASVLRDLGAANRGLLALTVLAGAFLVAVVVLADVLFDRVDLGRRRALGASRAAVVGLVVARSAGAGMLGAVGGSLAGTVVAALLGQAPPGDFVVGVAILASLATALGSLAPAIGAAWQDPVRVLRTP